ncbi:glycoside hydrolase family 1 protein [Patescibacteria group bacterium]
MAEKKKPKKKPKTKAQQKPKPLKPKKKGHQHEPLAFPNGFLWGASTSAHQVEGNNINNDWWEWEQKKDHVKNGDKSGIATDHYNRFTEDFELAAGMNHNAHRFSIEWSRIEPQEGKWDMNEVKHYRQVLRELRKNKLKPMVTLFHFTLPVWVANKGGWANAEIPKFFARYAEFIAKELGKQVDFWVTINEPAIYIGQAYVSVNWPPQEKSAWKAALAFKNLAKGHKLAYTAIHKQMKKQKRTAEVGISKNTLSIFSYRNKFFDYLYVRASEFIWNELFYSLTKRTHDFIGLNYYFVQRVRRGEDGRFIFVDVRKEERREISDLGWEVYAPGLFDVLLEFKKYKKPIYITENGIATTNDDKRSRYIVAHLKELYHAIQAGIDVRGYFHWSLLDNFEWNSGFDPRFGLLEVNYKTLKRKVRPSAKVYARIAKENKIPHSLLRFIGHGVKKEK